MTDERISDVSVLSDMIEIRNGFKHAIFLDMMMLTKSLLKYLYFNYCTIAILMC